MLLLVLSLYCISRFQFYRKPLQVVATDAGYEADKIKREKYINT